MGLDFHFSRALLLFALYHFVITDRTTKRTIMENEQMTTELQYQSKETEKLLVASTRLGAENKRLKRDIEIRKQTEEELAKRNHFYQKLIKKLNEKLKHNDADIRLREDQTRRDDHLRHNARVANEKGLRALQSKARRE